MKTDAGERVCRCEAAVPSQIMEGFACGNPDCWRTAPAKASFEAFTANLIRQRETDASTGPKRADS